MATVFFSYSHDDVSLSDQLEKHLSTLRRQGLIGAWHDRRILAGEEVVSAISASMKAVDVVLLLVSANFTSSEYCYSIELLRTRERHESVGAVDDWHPAIAC